MPLDAYDYKGSCVNIDLCHQYGIAEAKMNENISLTKCSQK